MYFSRVTPIRLFDLNSGRLLRRLQGHLRSVTTLRFSPNGKQLATSGQDARVRIWDVKSGKRLGQIRDLPESQPVAFLDGGKSLLIHQKAGEITVASTSSFEVLNRFRAPERLESSIALYLPKAQATRGAVGQVVCYEETRGPKAGSRFRWYTVPGGEPSYSVFTPNRHYGSAPKAFSPDASILALTSSAHIDLWDVKRGKLISSLPQHSEHITSLAFSPNGRLLAAGGSDTTILVWDVGRIYLEYALAEIFSGDQASRQLFSWPTQLIEKLEALLVHSAIAERAARPLIKNLDSDEFIVREKASESLAKLGIAVVFSLRLALKSQSLEVQARARTLLKRIGKHRPAQEFDPDHLWRVVTVLVWLDCPEARHVLEKLAKSYPDTRAGQEALEALRQIQLISSNR